MKMTFDLPPDIVHRLKLKAATEGLNLKDLVTEACRRFLSQSNKPKKRNTKTALFPLFKGGQPAEATEEMTPERVAEILYGTGEL